MFCVSVFVVVGVVVVLGGLLFLLFIGCLFVCLFVCLFCFLLFLTNKQIMSEKGKTACIHSTNGFLLRCYVLSICIQCVLE